MSGEKLTVLQVRVTGLSSPISPDGVTELPSIISAEGLTDIEGSFGASGRDVEIIMTKIAANLHLNLVFKQVNVKKLYKILFFNFKYLYPL